MFIYLICAYICFNYFVWLFIWSSKMIWRTFEQEEPRLFEVIFVVTDESSTVNRGEYSGSHTVFSQHVAPYTRDTIHEISEDGEQTLSRENFDGDAKWCHEEDIINDAMTYKGG